MAASLEPPPLVLDTGTGYTKVRAPQSGGAGGGGAGTRVPPPPLFLLPPRRPPAPPTPASPSGAPLLGMPFPPLSSSLSSPRAPAERRG